MIFNIDKETLPREDIEALQLRRLQDLCSRVYANVPFYRKRFDESGIKPGDIKSLADLKNLPFTEKQDLRNYYPFGLFAVPRDNIVRLHASSGTTGKAVVVGYTARDLHNWAELAGRSLSAAGVNQTDIVHVAYGYGLFTGGLGLHYGAEHMGATALPVSSGNTKRQVQLLQDFGSDILCCTPSYAMFIGETVRDMGIDPKTLKLRAGLFGAEPWTDNMRREIERLGYSRSFTIYDTSDSERIMKDIIKSMGLDDKSFPAKSVLSMIGRVKDRQQTPEAFARTAQARGDYRLEKIAEAYGEYQKRLKANNAVDFDDIIFHTVTLLQKDAEVREYYQNKFRYVLVDEYQDTNHLQYLLTNISWPLCWPGNAKTSAWWATTTSPSTASGGRTLRTS